MDQIRIMKTSRFASSLSSQTHSRASSSAYGGGHSVFLQGPDALFFVGNSGASSRKATNDSALHSHSSRRTESRPLSSSIKSSRPGTARKHVRIASNNGDPVNVPSKPAKVVRKQADAGDRKLNEKEIPLQAFEKGPVDFTLENPPPPRVPTHRTQKVRLNLEKYRIEQIVLRRIRYAIDNDESVEDHLAMIDLIEQSNAPPELIQKFFGPHYSNASDIRVLLLRSIAKVRNERNQSQEAFENTPPKKRPTTPKAVLRAISSAPRPMSVSGTPLYRPPSRPSSGKSLNRPGSSTHHGAPVRHQVRLEGWGVPILGTGTAKREEVDIRERVLADVERILEERRKKASGGKRAEVVFDIEEFLN
ncbi:hypothetical protein BJ742DRAFT_181502 [Cladochytrium replicatum]|nr:hypothetical protein BJ742DRAFT_181502 [Cladochytrium replicatum]